MNCIHGNDMGVSCVQCAEDLASHAQPYQCADKVEAIEFAEIPRAWPEAEGKPAIDAENSMAVATRELAESIAHLAPAVSALAAAYAGSSPKSTALLQAEACGFKSATGAPAGEDVNATQAPFTAEAKKAFLTGVKFGPIDDMEIAIVCSHLGWRHDTMGETVKDILERFARHRGLI